MELTPSDAKTLREMVSKEWFPHGERELEATFGVGGVVDSTRFLAVAQRLKSKGLKEIRQPDRLTISLEDNTRYTIQGEGTISQYCQDNKIAGKSAVVMIKDRAGDLHTLDIKDYDTRVKIRREIGLDLQDPRVKSHFATWDQRVKFFRLIQRWTFVGKGVIFDLSMVRSTKKDERGLWKQVKSFYDANLHHNIMKEMPVYEIEVELDRSSEDTNTAEKATIALIQGIGDVLRGIQRNPILIRNSTKEAVLEGYRELVGGRDEVGFRGFRGVQPITLERDNMEEYKSTRAHGAASIRHGYNVTDKADGLRVMGYCDDKGELFMLDMSLNVYRTGLKKLACANTLVDGEWVTKNKDNEAIQMLMLFDIYISNGNRETSKIEFYGPVGSNFGRYFTLVDWCKKWNDEGGPISLMKGLTLQNSLKVMKKEFLFAEGAETKPSRDIFTKCAQMLARKVNYNTDGLILTSNRAALPDRFGVRFNKQFKWKPAHDNTVDFLVKIVKDQTTNLDKLTDIIRPDSQDTIKYKTLRLYVGTSADPAYEDPRRTILMIKKLPSGRPGGRGVKRYRMRPILFNPLNNEDSGASICNLQAQEDPATRDWIVRCSTKDDAPGEATGDPITNNSIVEMRYDPDPNVPSGWNWVPIRVRYDKTERFQGGSIDKTLNSVETANSVWNSIHEPITKYMITTGADKPSAEEQQELYVAEEQKASEVKRYYQKKSTIKNISLVKTMAAFHNILIKGELLTMMPMSYAYILGMYPSASYKPKVIDTSIGKGGDIGRYYENVDFLLGIDLDADGIRDPDEGAYRRYMDRLVQSYSVGDTQVPTMVFLIGDSTKSYMDGKAGINEEEADMMRAVIGKVNPVAKVPPYIDAKCKGRLTEGADFMYSMFSIHYYFESKEKWEGFLNNIRDNLKVGGLFICCCFDGNIVTDKLKDVEKGESIQGTDPVTGATIWRITKENSLEDALPSSEEEGFGHAIDVEFLSIGSSHREYLVSPQLLKDQLRSIGVNPCTPQECSTMYIDESSTQSFQETYSNRMGDTKYPMKNEVKQFSFLNRWWIFRRHGTSADSTTTHQVPSSPAYSPDSPAYVPGTTTSPPFQVTSPPFHPSSPAYQPTSPPFHPASATPVYGAAPATPNYGAAPATPNYGAAPATPNYGAVPTTPLYGAVPTTPLYGAVPTTPLYGAVPTTPNYGAAPEQALLRNRPSSSAWNAVPRSGNLAASPTYSASTGDEDFLPPEPYNNNTGGSTGLELDDDAWYAKRQGITQRARDREEPLLPTNLSPEAREKRLSNAEVAAIEKATQEYFRRTGKVRTYANTNNNGLVTPVVEGGSTAATDQQGGDGRSVGVERASAAGPQKKFKPGEVFRFFGKAELKDTLGIDDAGAARWLALSAPFPIQDGDVEYPSVNHYLAAMKYKVATDKPELGADLFSKKGTIHTKYLRQRDAIAVKHKDEKERGLVKEHEDQELLRAEAADVADASLPKTIKRYKALFDEAKWLAHKDDALREALSQRWKHDARFRKIVEAAKLKGRYLLYYTGSSTISSFGGIRREDGRIEGENQVGRIIMELAGFPPL